MTGARQASGREPGTELVSVLIPAYNHERYVRRALSSVIEQTYPHIELLVLDDGSRDRTWEAVSEMAAACRERFVRFEMTRQENQGTCLTLNRLLEAARGGYILMMASDDVLKPDAVSRLLGFLRDHPDYGLAVGDNEIIDDQGRVVFWTKRRKITADPDRARYRTFGDFLRQGRRDVDFNSAQFGDYYKLIEGNHIPNGYLIRADLLARLRFSPEAPLEDHYLMLQLAKSAPMKYIDEVLFSYRWHGRNSIKNRDRMWLLSRRTLKHEMEILRQSGQTERLARVEEILNRVRRKVKLRLGRHFEIYRISTFFEKPRYLMRLDRRHLVLKGPKPPL